MRVIEWTPTLVEAHLADAAETMCRLPRPRPAGFYNRWPEVLRDEFELRATADGPPSLGCATPDAVTRAEEVLLWLRFLDRDDQSIVWARANRRSWKAIGFDEGIDRTTGWRRYKTALAVIAAHLNAAAGNAVATPTHAT
jgi:hypothetical protein